MSLDVSESAVCAVLRGIPDVWRDLGDGPAPSRFLAAANRHRLRPLIAWRLRQQRELTSWPESLRVPLFEAERAEAAIEIVRRLEICRLLDKFDAAGIPLLLFKGAALAYSLYPEPWLRPREDTDLLIRASDVAGAGRVLAAAGFGCFPMVRGEIVTHQQTYVRCDRVGLRHDWDLHWKIANPVVFADLVTPEELLRESEPVPLDGGRIVRVPSRGHALLLACLHRVSHHHDSGDLLWLHDIHLLTQRLTVEDAAGLVAIARRTGCGAICARGMRLASDRFETTLRPSLLADLEMPVDGKPSLPAAYLGSDVRKASQLMADLGAIPEWGRRLRLLREHLFPPADYVLGRHGQTNRLLLPALYAWRIVTGARGWFRPL